MSEKNTETEKMEKTQECEKEQESCENNEEKQEESIETLKQKIQELEASVLEQKEKYLMVHADFENTKKRLEREKYQAIDYSQEQFAKDLLPALDSLELAINSTNNIEEVNEESFDNFKKGIELTLEQFTKIFSKHYIETVSTEDGFDPNLHNAIMQVESDKHEAGQVVQVMQKGYKLKERVIRPSMVSISK